MLSSMPTSLKTILEEALTGYALPQPLLSKILEQPGGDHSTEKLGMINSNAKDFNGAMVSKDDEVQVLLSETTEGVEFHYILVRRKKGFIKAAYLEMM